MKRTEFLKYLRASGCKFVREGAKHSVFWNPQSEAVSTVPRHSDIDPYMTRKICKDLGVPAPVKK